MTNGRRLAFVMMMAFSTDCLSVGRPASDQARCCTGSDIVDDSVHSGVLATSHSCSVLCHDRIRLSRKSGVNGPRYAIPHDAIRESPIRFL